MSLLHNQIELLSPARDSGIAREAILHGADAVYLGGPDFGARHNAGNEIREISELVKFAHQYYAKIYITFNTILHDDELEAARTLIYQLYDSGVDALIIQDMGILELDIPPIELHASTQADIRTVEKAKFLNDVGFSQLVLARELSIQEIDTISRKVDAAIEYFIHGALCVAFSGQCYISHAQTGRSANRGDCSQACRLPYTLKDNQGRVVAYEKHLLSLKDNNQSENLLALIHAGVRSFKIEGRYKDISYVKNITAYYRQLLDQIMTQHSEFIPASSGKTEHFFSPNPDKTFHRGSTDYFAQKRRIDIGAFDSPKFIGLPLGEIQSVSDKYIEATVSEPLHNGDGLNVLLKREIIGFRADVVKETAPLRYRIYPNEMPPELQEIRPHHPLNRNLDHNWQQSLLKTSSRRTVAITFLLEEEKQSINLTAISEEGIKVKRSISGPLEYAKQPEKIQQSLYNSLKKLGQTIYYARDIQIKLETPYFIPSSQLNQLRREVIEQLHQKRLAEYIRAPRKTGASPPPVYPETYLTYLANVYNHKAREFYQRHGVQLIEAAFEAHQEKDDVPVMVTKHCLRFSFSLCPKQAKGVQGVRNQVSPMQLVHHNETFTLMFDCKKCEMQVIGRIKPHILKRPPPGSIAATIPINDLKKTPRPFKKNR